MRRSAVRLIERLGPGRAVACVLGDTDLLRALALAHVPSVVAVPPDEPAHYSRLAALALEWADPASQPELLFEILQSFAEVAGVPPVLFYDEDRYVRFLSRHRTRLAQHFRFVVPDRRLVEDVVDKARFQVLAERLHLPVPPGRLLDARTDPVPVDLPLPLVVKPRNRDLQWGAMGFEAKAVRVESHAALEALWRRLAVADVPVLVQQLIPGSEERVESYHVYIDARGEIAGEFGGRKLRTWPRDYGFSTALVTSDAPDVLAMGRDIVRRLGLHGVAKLDFKRAPDNRLYLLEVNARFNLWHHLGARAGVNLPALVYADLVGEPRPRNASGPARAGVRWCKPWQDLLAARAEGIRVWEWFSWMLGCEAKRGLAWDDPFSLVRAYLYRRARHGHAPGGQANGTTPVHDGRALGSARGQA